MSVAIRRLIFNQARPCLTNQPGPFDALGPRRIEQAQRSP